MFSIEDPFALSNKEMERLIANKKENLVDKGIKSLKENGIKNTAEKILRYIK